MTNQKYHINELVSLSLEEIWGIDASLGDITEITLDTGETVETLTRQLSRAWYYWEFNRQYQVPVRKNQIIPLNKWYTNGMHLTLLDAGLNAVYHSDLENGRTTDIQKVAELAVPITENIVNTVPRFLGEYVATVDLEDYRDFKKDPVIAEAKQEVIENIPKCLSGVDKYKWIQKGYETFETRIEDAGLTAFRYNGLSLLLNTSTLTTTQLRQSGMYRSFTTEIDSRFHPEPTLYSYAEGINTVWDMAKVSREGTKASYYAGEPVQDTELGNRLHQIVTSFLQNIHPGDCGTEVTYEVRLNEDNFNSYIGKYHTTDGSVKAINKEDRHLIGSVVNIRNPAGCKHVDRVGICETCLGEIAKSIPYNALAGHALGVELWAIITQLVISVKHDDTSSVGKQHQFDAHNEGKFVRMSTTGNDVYFVDDLKLDGITLSFNGKEAPYISDVNTTQDVSGLTPELLSELTEVVLTYTDVHGIEQKIRIPLLKGKSGACFTNDFLAYLKEYPEGHAETKQAKYTLHHVQLDKWDISKPVIKMPFKHYNMLDFHTDVTRFIESKTTGDEKLTDYTHFGKAVQAFKQVIASPKFKNINIAILEMAVYGFGIMRNEDGSVELLKNTTTGEFISLNQALKQHSITTHFIHEKQNLIFQEPFNYNQTNKLPHAYDGQLVGKVVYK